MTLNVPGLALGVGGGGGWVIYYVGQEGQLDLAKVGTKIPQLESCSAKLAGNPVDLVSALTRDLPDHKPIVICELFQSAGATGAWRSPRVEAGS